MRKRAYSGRQVKHVDVSGLVEGRDDRPVWAGVDVGKYELKIVVCWGQDQFQRPWNVKNPFEVPLAVKALSELARGRRLVVAMEPSGTYGDAFRQAALDCGLDVHRVHPKIAHDYAEVFDGVPSQHDGKDAALLADLARTGKSVPWPATADNRFEQELAYWVEQLDIHSRLLQAWTGRLESGVTRHWPEAGQLVKCSSPTLLRIFLEYGTPAALAQDPQAQEKLRRWSRALLEERTMQALIDSARSTAGVRMNDWDVRRMRQFAEGAGAARKTMAAAKRRLAQITLGQPTIAAMAQAVGLTTACVLWACLGDPHEYPCAEAYLKAMGLNLAERSSGTYEGRLKITKRGHGMVRYWMYLAAMRLVKEAPVRRWFEAKKQRDGNRAGGKAIVAVMRRLALALWHVGACGEAFEISRLFPGLGRKKGRCEARAR